MYLPRDIVHWFTNPSVAAARALILITPAGFERFFQDAGATARPGEQAPPFNPDEAEHLAELTRQYGGEIRAPSAVLAT